MSDHRGVLLQAVAAMTEYAVTVEYTGDFIVEAESPDEAYAHVEAIIPSSTPDSDWYFCQIVGVKEEK